MERLTLTDLQEATGGVLSPGASTAVSHGCQAIQNANSLLGVSCDSRTLRPGDAFFALRGTRQDGHDFIDSAAERGAAVIVTSRPVSKPPGCPILRVSDPATALGRLAAWYRRLLDVLVIGVTGSVGKTTTRELLHLALGGSATCQRSERNYNNRIGVPLTLLSISSGHRFAVVEMGASAPGEIALLAALARPEAAVITQFGVAHAATFGGTAAIVAAKSELLDVIPQSGIAWLPAEHPASRIVARRCRGSVRFLGEPDAHSLPAEGHGGGTLRYRFTLDGTPFEVRGTGRHVVRAAATAVLVARHFGQRDMQIAHGLRQFEPVAGRGRAAVTVPWTVIDDGYNANPDSMRAAVNALSEWPATGRRIFVCGEMYGLGPLAPLAHYELGRHLAARAVDLVVAIGEQARRVAHGARRGGMEARRLALFVDRDTAAGWLAGQLRPGDIVWTKASRPVEMEQLVAVLVNAAHLAEEPRRRAA